MLTTSGKNCRPLDRIRTALLGVKCKKKARMDSIFFGLEISNQMNVLDPGDSMPMVLINHLSEKNVRSIMRMHLPWHFLFTMIAVMALSGCQNNRSISSGVAKHPKILVLESANTFKYYNENQAESSNEVRGTFVNINDDCILLIPFDVNKKLKFIKIHNKPRYFTAIADPRQQTLPLSPQSSW